MIFDNNEGADINYTRIDVHQNDSLESPIICYFETPTNLTLQIGGTHLEYAIIFKRLTATEAQPITSGAHIYEINASDDDSQYNISTFTHILYGEPHFTNLNPLGSYIHRTKDNPALEDIVAFGVYIIDFNTPTSNITVKFYYSTNKLSWYNKTMTYDGMLEYWATTLGPYLAKTGVYYYVTANDTIEQNRTPETYDYLLWDLPTVEENYRTLYKGWNLISINIESDFTAMNFLNDTRITSVIRYEPQSQAFDIAIKNGANNFNIDYEWGYYVYATQSLSFEIKGQPVLNQSLILYRHWNLYGVTRTRSCSSVASTSPIDVIVARTFYGGYPTFKEGYTEDFMMVKEYGYWLYSLEETQWYP